MENHLPQKSTTDYLKTGGSLFEKANEIQNPEVEELVGRSHIVEWNNDFDISYFNWILISELKQW